MSLKKQAARIRAQGRKNEDEDSVLAHISPAEAALLKARGGSGRIDPQTGLPHFDEGDSGGYGDRGPGGSSGPMNTASDGSAGATGYGPTGGGYAGVDNTYDAPYTYNAAKDSQQANEDLGLTYSPDTNNYNKVDYSGYGGSMSPLARTLSDWGDTPFGKITRTALNFTPLGRLANVGYSLATGQYGNAASSAIGGLPGTVAGIGINAAMGNPVGSSIGATAGGMFGSQLAGPTGGYLGSLAGQKIGSAVSNGQGTPNTNTSTGGGASNLISDLGSIYGAYTADRNATNAANNAATQANTLADMYSSNGAYAQQLRQQLERQDAAAGRRSQYGNREVELQAKLADAYARNASAITSANNSANNLANARNAQRAQILAAGLKGAQALGLDKTLPDWWNSSGTSNKESSGNFWDSWI